MQKDPLHSYLLWDLLNRSIKLDILATDNTGAILNIVICITEHWQTR